MKLVLLGLFGAWVLTASEVQAQTQSVANGQTVQVNAHGVCYNVTNSGGPTTMIPLRTAAEWSNFRNHKPGHISLSSCCTTEGPYFSQWTYYWNYSTDTTQRNFSWNGTQYYPVTGTSYSVGGWTYYMGTLQVNPYSYSVYRTNC